MENNSLLEKHFRLSPFQKKALQKLGPQTVLELLYFFPVKYGQALPQKNINELQADEQVTVYGKIVGLETGKTWKSKKAIAKATLVDQTGKIKILWIHQPYIAKMFRENSYARVSGKVSQKKSEFCFINPEIERVDDMPMPIIDQTQKKEKVFLEPTYRESRGISSRWIYFHVDKILKSGILDKLNDPIPKNILEKYNLPSLRTSLIWIHMPKRENDYLSARKRFAFEEIFFIQLQKQHERKEYEEKSSFKIDPTKKELDFFVDRLPFKLTDSQNKSVSDILGDFKKDYPMSRLLEGDVGSGKTAVAAITSYACITTPPKDNRFGKLQVTYMAPTEILANQHFKTFIETFAGLNIKIGLLTGSGCKKFPSKLNPKEATPISKTQLLKWVADGDISILIGTHALISSSARSGEAGQKSITFKNLAYVIIDEQHRFGVTQRQSLARRQTRELDANLTQTNVDQDTLLYRDLSYRIKEVILKVKKEIGLGHKEIVYQKALSEEFNQSNLKFSREHRIPIKYKNKIVGTYVPDFVIDNKIIVELKSVPKISGIETKQLWNYLKGSDFKLAFLVNFSFTTVDIKRIVYDTARNKLVSSREVGEKSAFCPHLLSMTATPIPRTLALTIYGDLDLTLLDQMPAGRKTVITEVVPPSKRGETYQKIKRELQSGRQLYVICPRIDEPDPAKSVYDGSLDALEALREKEQALNVKSVTEEAVRLKKEVFPEYEIGILHSKLKKEEKEEVMKDFEDGKIQILCATSVIEVGINVPNATTIIIEGAERFGLAQLHQLRGRVIRSSHQAYCYVFSEGKTQKSIQRLKALTTAKNGFELAELDLAQRGAGELSGKKQWGISDLGMEAIKNIKMVEAARNEARAIVDIDPDFKETNHLSLKEILETQKKKIHFE